jgi:hypothetical protein
VGGLIEASSARNKTSARSQTSIVSFKPKNGGGKGINFTAAPLTAFRASRTVLWASSAIRRRLVWIKPLALCKAFGVLARGTAYDRIGTWSDKHKANHRRIHYIGITVGADK